MKSLFHEIIVVFLYSFIVVRQSASASSIQQCFHHHHHHHVVPLARISLTLSRHFSLSFIASGRSSGLHPVSSYSCWMYVRAGRPAFARPYAGFHRSTWLMSSSLFLQQCPVCLVHLTWIVFVMGGRWLYSRCLVGSCCMCVWVCVCVSNRILKSGVLMNLYVSWNVVRQINNYF